MPQFLQVAESAARAAGQLLLKFQEGIVASEKGRRDLVTKADLASQRTIRDILLAEFPEHDFLGEEVDIDPNSMCESNFRWIVDPLDGTTNYVHGLQTFAVSIALEQSGQLIAGVVYDPVRDECFTAQKDGGTHLNGRPLSTSSCTEAEAALVAASFSPLVSRESTEVTRFIEALQACQGVRRLGSAALNLAYVAAGRLDAYWATSVKVWDIAAGLLLVQEAGGFVTNMKGGLLSLEQPELLAAATEPLRLALVQILNDR